jgi:hypothetical protein
MVRVHLLVITVVPTKDQSLAEIKSVRVALDPSVDSACQADGVAAALRLSEVGQDRTWLVFDARDGFDVSKSKGKKHYRLREDAEADTDIVECDDEPLDDFVGALNSTLTAVELVTVIKEGQKIAEQV